MKKFFPGYITLAILALGFGVFAFINSMDITPTSSNSVAKEETGHEGHEESSTEVASDYNGEEVYKQSCISCHGDQYQGSVGPALKGIGDKYSEEEIAAILKDGKGGMPGGLVSGNEEKMAQWLASLK